jgi:hypothetical protein
VSRFESWAIHLSTLLVGGTGLVYAWMAYLVRPSDPYAIVNHPLQPQLQHGHVLVAPLLVFAVGLIWQRHIGPHWSRGVRKGRRSGMGMVLTLVPMVASGYLIQTAVDGSWRKAWVVVHLFASVLWLAGYLAHQLPLLWNWLSRRRAGHAPSDPSPSFSDRSKVLGDDPSTP